MITRILNKILIIKGENLIKNSWHLTDTRYNLTDVLIKARHFVNRQS
jgi:hypothetical protein